MSDLRAASAGDFRSRALGWLVFLGRFFGPVGAHFVLLGGFSCEKGTPFTEGSCGERVSGTFCEELALRVLCTKGTGHSFAAFCELVLCSH
ncbi:MAG: hypothetical protein EA381_00075 [Planctomycetaceae bacterium]|nr:MAG: hypothetical protein EA381_00075 [Planctomycetaceae bacterium]